MYWKCEERARTAGSGEKWVDECRGREEHVIELGYEIGR